MSQSTSDLYRMMCSYDSFPMYVRQVANALSDRSSVLNRDCLYFNVHSYNRFYNAAFFIEFVCQSSHTTLFKTHVMNNSGDNTGLVLNEREMSVTRCNNHPIVLVHHMPRSSLFCLLAFYGIPTFHTFFVYLLSTIQSLPSERKNGKEGTEESNCD